MLGTRKLGWSHASSCLGSVVSYSVEIGKIYNDARTFLLPSSELAPLTTPKYEVTWKTFILPLIGLAAFFAYIYIFNVDLQEIVATAQKTNLYFYVVAAIATILDTLFFALAWYMLLRFLSVRISWFRAFMYVWVGIFVDTLIPAESVSGEITKIYLVNREQSGSAGRATASVVAHRIIGTVVNVATLLAGAFLLLVERNSYEIPSFLIPLIVGLTLLFLVMTLLLCVKESWTLRALDALIRLAEYITRGRWKLDKLKEEAIEASKSFHAAMKEYVRGPKTLFATSVLTVISWVLTLVVLQLTLLSIGYYQLSWSAVLVISSIFMAIKSIPVGVPFEVGLPEAALTTMLSFFGVPWGIGATATILMRLLTLWLKFFFGFVAQQWIGIKAVTAKTEIEEKPSID